MASDSPVPIPRRRFVVGAVALATVASTLGVASAARPSITVHKDPT